MDQRDVIGQRGELIFRVLITRRHPDRGFLFDSPRFLGEKHQATDFLVEPFHEEALVPYFFVQVRTTGESPAPGERLKVRVSADALRSLAAYPAPTYIVGIDEPNERGYLVSANGERARGFSSMCTDHPLEPNVLARLWDEVRTYWTAPGRSAFRSEFVDPRWRQP